MARTVGELAEAYRNENAHADQVMLLALAIWDAVSPVFAFKPSERRLMKAAAQLHDIGYSRYPEDHHAGSHAIILKEGIAGFSERQCRIIACAVLLHRRKFGPALALPIFSDPAVREPAMRLGAILRIADGLDHSHCGNAAIVSLLPEGDRVLCTIASPGYDGNLPKARANADLWLRVFKVPFVIDEVPAGVDSPRYAGIVRPGDPLPGAMRKLLFLHFRLLTEQHDGMIGGKSDEPLHDARLALRRYRSLLRLFGHFLPDGARLLDRRLCLLCRRLSDFRDADVWISFLSRLERSPSFGNDAAFARFLAAEKRLHDQKRGALAALLAGRSYRDATRAMVRLPRVDLARIGGPRRDLPVAAFAGRMLSAAFYDILSRPGVKRKTDPEAAHRLRRRCRRLRYWAEFFTPALGDPAGRIAMLMKELADTLGDLHDTDCFAARIAVNKGPIAERIRSRLEHTRKKQLDGFTDAWKRLRSDEILDAASALAAAGKELPRLTIVRHATAVDGPVDRNRPLSDNGTGEAKLAGRVLRLLGGPPASIVSSPLLRAFETSRRIAEAFSPQPVIERRNWLTPEADVGAAIRRLAATGGQALCVGHLPQLDLLVQALLADTGRKPPHLGRGSVCRITFPEGKIEAGKGVLEWCLTQGKLARVGKRAKG